MSTVSAVVRTQHIVVDPVSKSVAVISSGPPGPPGADGPAGPPGAAGAPGAAGPPGAAGQGVPVGGTAGQVLSKIDGTNYNTQWATPTGGTGVDDVWVGPDDPIATTPTIELWYDTDEPATLPADLRWNTAWGVVALAKGTAGQSGIGSTAVDITGMSVTFTPVAGRLYKTTAHVMTLASGANTVVLNVTDAANTSVQQANQQPGSGGAGGYDRFLCEVVESDLPSVPTVRKARLSSQPGTVQTIIGSDFPAQIVVEDVGPVAGAIAIPNPTPAWQNLALTNGYTAVSGRTPQIRMVGDEVQCRGTALVPAGVSPYIATLPIGYRPAIYTNISVAGWSSGVIMARIAIDPTNGILVVQQYSTGLVVGTEIPLDMVRFSVTP